MKTEFQILHRPDNDDQAADVLGEHETLEVAMARTGFPLASEWDAIDRNGQEPLWICNATPGREQQWMIVAVRAPETVVERVELAVEVAVRYGGIEGDHHKNWVIDQVVRLLTGDHYPQIVAAARAGADGPDTHSWDTGIAP